MSYSVLGTSCVSRTMAFTSNHKFLPLKDPVYRKQYTYMMQYPGDPLSTNLQNVFSVPDHTHPKVIKSYYGKIYEHDVLQSPEHPPKTHHTRTHESIPDHAPGHGHLNGSFQQLGTMTKSCMTCN